jgi:AcrR family transcriptional regulator
MSHSSGFAKPPRRVPRQERGERRVAEVLDAAAAVIAEVGYDAATMTAVAERAGASIGTVYQYFPNKDAIVVALRDRYGEEMRSLWLPVVAEADTLSIRALIDRMLGVLIAFIESHPAYFALTDAPVRRQKNHAARSRLRAGFAEAFRRKQPSLSEEEASRIAWVAVEITKDINALYAEAKPKEREAVVAELKLALVAYLEARLAPRGSH